MKRVLVIEDEEEIRRLVEIHLRSLECEVTMAADGTKGLEQALRGDYDLIVLDLMLPGLNGLDICRQVRASPRYTPILILTARSSEGDRVLGLDSGADDYLTKPFSVRELVARVKAIFRRIDALRDASSASEDVIRNGGLVICTTRRDVRLGDRPIHLTAKEFDLLVQFARHPGRVYTRSELLDLVWGYAHEGYEHTVNSHINRLRSKIEEHAAKPRYILTVWGVGYKFSDADENALATGT